MKHSRGSVLAGGRDKCSRCYSGAAGCEFKYVSEAGTWEVGCPLKNTEMLRYLV